MDEVCPETKSSTVIERSMELCLNSDSKNPIKILRQLMKDPDVPFHGPVHHSLIPFAVLTAYKNAGGDIDLEEALKKAHSRGSIIPGAVCGHWGACGAALGCGIAFSVITNDGPLAGEVWRQGNTMVSGCLTEIGKYGGPRCCKRNGHLAIIETAERFKDLLGVELEIPENVKCGVYPNNPVCLKTGCPFYPKEE
jgi:hypothetical protein